MTALVTGASSGLGLRFAQVLAACGARVALAGRRSQRLADNVAAIAACGGVAEPVTLDVTEIDSFPAVVDRIEARFGTVNALVNSAGVPDGSYATKLSGTAMNDVVDTNLRGPFALACEVARRMIEAETPGRIVNVSSMLAFDYGSDSAAALYSTVKSGIARMTEALALEWARFHINVNAIAPGLIESEMTAAMLARTGDGVVEGFPRRRIGKPSHLDSTLLFLVSPASDFVTGTVVKVDDGQGRR